MVNFLVTGANGFIGRALCDELGKRGYGVRGAVRNMAGAVGLNVPAVPVGEISGSTDWAEALSGIDVVVHLAARVHVLHETVADPMAAFREVNVEGTRRLAYMAAEAGVRRIVYVSSIGVNGNGTVTNHPFSEDDVPAPYSPYAMSKWEAEQVLSEVAAATGIEMVMVRPPLVYGPFNPGNFLRLLKLVKRRIPLPFALVGNRRSMIYLHNLIDALITCATNTAAVGKCYLVSDGEDISTNQLIRSLAGLMNKPSLLWPVPPVFLWMAGWLTGKSDEVQRLLGSLEIDSSRIRSELGWMPPFTLGQGLAETVRWFEGRA